MRAFDKPVGQVTYADIERLVTDRKAPESLYLDYKREAYAETRDLLKDVSAFANAYGGDIIIGVEDDGNGNPARLAPLSRKDAEEERDRYEQAARSAIDPPIPGLQVMVVPNSDDKAVIVVSVPRSTMAPHMMTKDRFCNFWRRHGTSTVLMTVGEIGDAFRLSGDIVARGSEYMARALERRFAQQGDRPAVIMCMVPLVSLPRPLLPSDEMARDFLSTLLGPDVPNTWARVMGLSSPHEEVRPTLWGLERRDHGTTPSHWTCLHRNGCFEHANTLLFDRAAQDGYSRVFVHGLVALAVAFFRAGALLCDRLGYSGQVLAGGGIANTRQVQIPRYPPIGDWVADSSLHWTNCPHEPHLHLEPWSYETTQHPDSVAFDFLSLLYNAFGLEEPPDFDSKRRYTRSQQR